MSSEEAREEREAVERFAREEGVSLEEAWAERAKWKAESVVSASSRRVHRLASEVRLLAADLSAARKELRAERRRLDAAESKRDEAAEKIAELRRGR